MIGNSVAREVVITGVGILSPIGIGIDAFWESLANGVSGIRHNVLFEGVAAPGGAGGEVQGFTDESARQIYLKGQRKSLKAMSRETQLGVASALMALDNSQINLNTIDPGRMGVEFGANLMFSPPADLIDGCRACYDDSTAHFESSQWGQSGLPKMEPLWLLKYLPNMPACHISVATNPRGPSNSLTLEEASGNAVIGEATRILQRGDADVMIVGTTGTTLHPIKTVHCALWGDLAQTPDAPAARSRPFDLNRSGWIVAEGSCSFILEDREHAECRNAKIWGRVLGTHSSCVTNAELHGDYRRALANAMRGALHEAGLRPDQIGHINAHGLGTAEVDRSEALAILDVFGEELGRQIPVTAPKSFLGNAGAGSGLLELAASVIGVTHGTIPYTLNYETPDSTCPLNVVSGQLQTTLNRVLLNVNVTRIGQASAAIVEVFD